MLSAAVAGFSPANRELLRANTDLIRKKGYEDQVQRADTAVQDLQKLSGIMGNFGRIKYGSTYVVSAEDQAACYSAMIENFGLKFRAEIVEPVFEILALGYTFGERTGVAQSDLEFVYEVVRSCLHNTSLSDNLRRTDKEFVSYLAALDPVVGPRKVADLDWRLSQGCFVTF